MRRKTNVRNEQLQKLVSELKKLSIDKNVKIWKRIAEDLEKPVRQKRIVNIYKLSQNTKEDEVVIVPGKVLGTGDLTHKISVAAYNFSEDAQKKIAQKGTILTIQELMKKNPEGKKIKIIG